MTQTPKFGLIDRIKSAKTRAEIAQLLHEGETYHRADVRTMKRWRNVANRRRSEIGHTADTCE